MKKKFSTLLVTALLITSISFATIRRVGYSGIPRAGVDYAISDFALAHDASSAGDTIQLYNTGTGSLSGTLTKRLVIIGFGYNLDINQNLQAIGTDAPSTITLTFDAGSENSIIEGCTASITVYVSNITIRRCFAYQIYLSGYTTINNTLIESCVVYSEEQNLAVPCTNTRFYNCIIQNLSFGLPACTGSVINCVTPVTFYGTNWYFRDANFLVKNCILANYDAGSINTVFESNFFGAAQPSPLPAGSNNRWSQDWAVLFNRLGGTDDAPGASFNDSFDEDYYVLKAGSPAINGGLNAANNPTDAGIYGGEPAYRYKLSGIPAIPAIYKLTAPTNAATTNPYNVTISVRSNN